ncbi:MAG: hypothetical protein WBG18_06060 [Xanthobacteraceae bacterium]
MAPGFDIEDLCQDAFTLGRRWHRSSKDQSWQKGAVRSRQGLGLADEPRNVKSYKHMKRGTIMDDSSKKDKKDPFNPAALRLDQSYADTVGVKKHLMTVPVRKPIRQDFIRVHPDAEYRLAPAAIIELKEDREVYLVTPDMAQDLPDEFAAAVLSTAINRQGVLFLWPVKLPGPDGKHNEWHRSAAEAADLATKRWIRLTANMSLGAYEVFEATGDLPEPVWPDIPFPEILKIAFSNRIVDRTDHPLVQRLRGQI